MDRSTAGPLLDEVGQPAAARRVAELAQRLRLNLADALAGDPQALAHLLEGALLAALRQAEAELEDAALARRQGAEDVLDLEAEHRQRGHLERCRRQLVLDEVAQG